MSKLLECLPLALSFIISVVFVNLWMSVIVISLHSLTILLPFPVVPVCSIDRFLLLCAFFVCIYNSLNYYSNFHETMHVG